jgi:diguanylate cyclase (GGDEF)-like protein
MSRWIQEQLRDCDHLARLGGEEFAVLLPQCNEPLALEVAERIRAYVASQLICFQAFEFSITLSIGVSTFNPELFAQMSSAEVAEKLVAFADLGVYDAKESGRNQVKARLFEAKIESMAQASA